MSQNEEFKRILSTPKRDLPEVPRTAMQNPYLHHKFDMLMENYYDELNREQAKFLDEVVVAQADDSQDGRILVPADNPQLARRILREIRVLDPSIELDPIGAMLPEELPEDLKGKPVNKGGRPRKQYGPSPIHD
jgi:hypothetical protein